MALLMLEGFEGAGTAEGSGTTADMRAYLEARYPTVNLNSGGTGSVRVSSGWGTGKAMSWGDDFSADANWFQYELDTAVGEIWIGMAVKPHHRQANGHRMPIVTFFLNTNQHTRVDISNGQTLQVNKENFARVDDATAPGVLVPGAWNYIEMRLKFSASPNGEVEFKVNGQQVLNATGLDLDRFGDTTINKIRFSGGEGTGVADVDEQWHVDDIYVDDAAFQDPIKIEAVFPTAEGATIDFTPSTGTDNSANVDDNPRNDDTDYNDSADTPSNKDLLAAGNLSQITGGIIGVQVSAVARLDTAGSIGLQSIVAEGTPTPTQGTGSVVEVDSTTDWKAVKHIFELNPDTSAAWTTTEVDGMEIGYEVD